MNGPDPLPSLEAVALLEAHREGRDVVVRRLLDPADLLDGGADAVVVAPAFDAAVWERCCRANVAAVVARRPLAVAPADGPPRAGPDTPALWWVADPRLALARLSRRLDPRRPPPAGVHPTATVDATARLGEGVAIGPHAVVAAGADLAEGVTVGPGSIVGRDARIGASSVLRERVVVADGVVIGARCLLQAGAVVGSDGFGFAAGPRGAERIHHLGTVVLGDDVEVGANACIDRATLGATVVGDRSKLDNLVQVAHNVRIGSDVLIAGLVGIAGSSTIGDRTIVGGAAGFADHVRVGAGARIAGGAGVTKDVPAGESWGGYPAQPLRRWARERYLIGKLEAIWAAVQGRR